MNRTSYTKNAIKFTLTASKSKKLPEQQELMDYLFGQIICPPDSISQQEEYLLLETCNMNGFIEFIFTLEQITGQADTSLAGPGFHQAVVLLLEQIAMKYKLVLLLKDACGFYENRDFVILQNHYIEHLFKSLGELRTDVEHSDFGDKGYLDRDKLLASMQRIDIRPIRKEEILTPMGAFSAEYILTLKTSEDKRTFSSKYFLWFTSEQGEQYEQNLKTFEDWNRQVDFKQGMFYDSQYAGIGYRNGTLLHTLPGGWEIPLPGAYEPEYTYDEEERETYPIYFILEEQQIRFLNTYTTNSEDWEKSTMHFNIMDNSKYYSSDKF